MVFSANGIELWRKPVVTVQTMTRFGSAAKAESDDATVSARTRRLGRGFFIGESWVGSERRNFAGMDCIAITLGDGNA